MSNTDREEGKTIGEILVEIKYLRADVKTLKDEVAELKNTRSKFFYALAWASGLGISGGALGGKLAHIAGWLEPK